MRRGRPGQRDAGRAPQLNSLAGSDPDNHLPPPPRNIWRIGVDQGVWRLERTRRSLAATGLMGGIDIALGVVIFVVTVGALATVMPFELAKVLGSLAFGIGLVFVVVGRSELFTENFLIPTVAVFARRGTPRALARLWGMTLVFNTVGLAIVGALVTIDGVLSEDALKAMGHIADVYTEREVGAAFVSAVVAGAVMTVFTWLAAAPQLDISRIVIALLLGFVLSAPSLNHAVVGFAEVGYGIMADTAKDADWAALALNSAIAIVGNVVGGMGFVTLTRLLQVHGE